MKSKVILFCALFLCSKFVASIPFENEELSRHRAYQPRNWQSNQNTAEQHHGSDFTRTQTVNSMTNSAQQFENDQEYNSHQGRQHFENQGYNNQASLLQSVPSKDSQVNFAQTNERRLDSFPTRRENFPVRANDQFISHNRGNRFTDSAQSATASATSIDGKPLVRVNEPYHSPGQQQIQFKPPVHEQSQQLLINQRQTGGLLPVSRDLHYRPIAEKSDNIEHVEHPGSRVGAVRYENYNEAHTHSSSVANSGRKPYIPNPRPYALPPRSQHFEPYNEPAVVNPDVFKHPHGSYFGHHGPANNANKFNGGRVIPANTGFNNEHIKYIKNPTSSTGPNNNGYQAPIGNIKYLDNPINSGSSHPAPLPAYRNDKISVIHSELVNQVPSTQNSPVAPAEMPKIIDEPDDNRHVHNSVIRPKNDNQSAHTYSAPVAPVEIPTILDEPENNRLVHNRPDNQGPDTYVADVPVDEQIPVMYSGQEDDNTYNAPIDTPETYDESDDTRFVGNPVISSESNYPAPVKTNEPPEPQNEANDTPLIHDFNKDTSIPIDKFIDNLYKSGEKYNINPADREKLKENLSKTKKMFLFIDTESGRVEYINDLQTREPPNYVVMKKDDKQDDSRLPPSLSQPSNPISEEPEPPVGINKSDHNPSSKFPIDDDYNPLPVRQPSNNNKNDYNSSPQFPIGDDYNPLPVKQPPNNNQNDYNSSPQFPIDVDYKQLPVKQPPNSSDYNESPIQQPQPDNDNNSPSELANHNNNYYKPPSRPQMSNDNNYNPTYEPQYPNVFNHHNYHHKPQRPPHVHGHQYHPYNPTWGNNAPGPPSKLHTHVHIPTSTTPAPVENEDEPKKLHTHVHIPTSTTPVVDEDEPKKIHTHVYIPTSTTSAPEVDEDAMIPTKEKESRFIHKHVPTSTTPAKEIDEEELKKYLDSHSTHHKPSSNHHGHSNDNNDNSNKNDKSHTHKSSEEHTTSTTTTTTESDEFIEEFLEALSKKSEDSDIPCNDDKGVTSSKPSKSDENKPLNNVKIPSSEDDDQIITLSSTELATDNVRNSTHHLHHDKPGQNTNKSKTHNQSDDKVDTKNKKHDCSDEDTPNPVNVEKPDRLQHDTLARNASKSKTNTKSHSTLKSSEQNQGDDKDSTKNKKHDCCDDDADSDVKEDTKKTKTKTAHNNFLTNTDVPAIPDDNSAAETNSENPDDVYTSDSTITSDYLFESPMGELKITVSVPNDSDGTYTINVQVPDSTGDEDTSGEDLVVNYTTKNSSDTVSKTSKQSTQTTDSQGWDQNKNMVLDLSNAVVLMNKTSDRDYLSQLMPNNSSLTVFIIEMPHQDKSLVESYKETKIYPNGTCVEETKKTTWKNEHDQVPTVVTTRKIYSCDSNDLSTN